MDPDIFFSNIKFNDVVIWVMAFFGLLSLVITMAESAGLLPPKLMKILARNRVESTLEVFRQLGVRIVTDDPIQQRSSFSRMTDALGMTEAAHITALKSMLIQDTHRSRVDIGSRNRFESDSFIDVIGASTSRGRAEDYARILNSANRVANFDLIATPKLGSPILGYEFSRINDKPFILGSQEKVRDLDGAMNFHNFLDFPKGLLLQGKRCLIVDDSTTGGRKVVDLILKLRAAGVEVKDVLVLFEPKGKGAREKLKAIDVELHSLVEGPIGRS